MKQPDKLSATPKVGDILEIRRKGRAYYGVLTDSDVDGLIVMVGDCDYPYKPDDVIRIVGPDVVKDRDMWAAAPRIGDIVEIEGRKGISYYGILEYDKADKELIIKIGDNYEYPYSPEDLIRIVERKMARN